MKMRQRKSRVDMRVYESREQAYLVHVLKAIGRIMPMLRVLNGIRAHQARSDAD